MIPAFLFGQSLEAAMAPRVSERQRLTPSYGCFIRSYPTSASFFIIFELKIYWNYRLGSSEDHLKALHVK